MALTERLAIILDANAGPAVRAFKDAADGADKLDKSARKAKSGVDDIGAGAGKTGGLLGKLADKAGVSGQALKAGLAGAGVAAVGLLGAAATNAVRKFLDLASAVDDFQDVTGASAKDASQLVNVVKQLGISPEVASKAFFNLGKTIGAGTSSLDKYGVSVARNKDGTVDLVGTLANVSRAYRESGDATERNALAAAAFGKSASQLPDLLDLTEQQLRELAKHGPIFTQEDLDSAREAEISIRQAGEAVDAAQAKAGGWLATNFNDFISGLDTLKEKLGFAADGSAVAARAARQQAAETGLLGDEAKEAAEKIDAERNAALELRSSLLGTITAQRSLEDASRGVKDAEASVAEKRKALNDLMKSAVVDAKALEGAQRSLASAERGLASAQERQVEAAEALKRAQSYNPDDLAEADLNRRDALLGVAEAQDRVEQAQQDLNDAQRDGDPEAVDDATRALAAANLGLERAQRAATAAAKAQNDLNPNSEAGAKRVADAERDLQNANQEVENALYGVRDASEALATVQAGDPDRAAKIAAAYRDLVGAQRDVTDAKYGELQAALDLEDARYREAVLLGAGGDAAERLNKQLQALAKIYPQLAPLLGGLLGATGTQTTYIPGTGIPSNAPSSVGRRATGGPVNAGSTYLVGERGPELLTMGGPGYVTPNGVGGGTIIVNMPPGSDGDDVVAALRRWQRRSGPIPISTRG